MKTIKLLLSLTLATAFTSGLFGAAYMKFNGVDGESRSADHKGWTDLLSVSGLAEATTRDAASGMATGKRQHKPVTITKEIDKATPLLAKGASLGTSVSLSADGVLYKLEEPRVASVTRKGNIETITLTCTSVTAMPKGTPAPKAEVAPAAPAVRGAPAPQAAPAQDYNSSRSNRSE